MVATKLTEVTAKGIDWAYSSSPKLRPQNEPTQHVTTPDIDTNLPPTVPTESSIDNYWNYASSKVYGTLDQANATLAGMVSSLYTSSPADTNLLSVSMEASAPQEQKQPPDSTKTLSSVWKSATKYPDMHWMLRNPYTSIRGRHHSPQSVDAVRSLLALVPVEETKHRAQTEKINISPANDDDGDGDSSTEDDSDLILGLPSDSSLTTRSETASQLAEGKLPFTLLLSFPSSNTVRYVPRNVPRFTSSFA